MALIILGSGVAVDMTRMHKTRMSLQDIADGAALAAVSTSGGDKVKAEAIASQFVTDHVASLDYNVTLTSTSATYNSDVIDVRLNADVSLTYGAFIGSSVKPVGAGSRAIYDRPQIEEFPEVSVAFVLDISGSMETNFSGRSRLDTLQKSVKDLFLKIQTENSEDPDLTQKLRTGVYAYSRGISDRHSHPIANGWSHTIDRVEDMTTQSVTIPPQAMEAALQDLRDEPLNAEGEERQKVLVYMTDGQITEQYRIRRRQRSLYHDYRGSPFTTTRQNYTERTIAVCGLARDEGMTVIAVGMNAPSVGVSVLIRCSEAGDLDQVASYFRNSLNGSDFDEALNHILPAGSSPTARLMD